MSLSEYKPPAPSGYNVEHNGYWRCGQYEGTPPAAKPTTLWCDDDAIGRYLYIVTPANNYLTICEVEAYGLGKYSSGIFDEAAQHAPVAPFANTDQL